MNSVGFNPNYTTQYKNNKPAFKGIIGEKFVQKMAKGETVVTKDVMEAVKGTFGPKSERVKDVVDSFLHQIKMVTETKDNYVRKFQTAEKKLVEMPQQYEKQLLEREQELGKVYSEKIKEKDVIIASRDAQILSLKKYEGMAKVKSIADVGTVMPEEAIKVLGEAATHQREASNSMFEFLMTGKGQEKALKQIERNNTITRAFRDGVLNIPEVEKAQILAQNQGFYSSYPSDFALGMVKRALMNDSKGSYLASPVIRKQVKDNAMGLIVPLCDEGTNFANSKRAEETLEKTFDHVVNYHKNFAKGKEKYEKEGFKFTNYKEGVDIYHSTYQLEQKGLKPFEISLWQISERGSNHW